MFHDKKSAPIVITGAMEYEYRLIASRLDGAVTSFAGGHEITEGFIDGYPVVAVRTLIGGINAAAVTSLAAERYSPRCLIVQGMAGGHNPSIPVGDIVLCENMLDFSDFCSPPLPSGAGVHPENYKYIGAELMSDGKLTRVRAVHSDPRLLEIADAVPHPMGQGQNIRHGTSACSDAWNREIDRIVFLHEKYGTDCEEMEGFAAGLVCLGYGIPMIDVRIISNSELFENVKFDVSLGEICEEYCLGLIRGIIKEDLK